MKKIMLVLLFVLAITAFFSCEKTKKSVKDTRPTIKLITDVTGIDDKSFNAAAWRGILSFYGDTWEKQVQRGKLYDAVTCQTQDLYIPTLKQAADEGYDIICVTGFTFADALSTVAPLYPKQSFMIVDVDWVNKPNVAEYSFSEEQGSFLVGVVAAFQSQADKIANPKFGFIGGVPGLVITKFEMGYIQGVRSVLPNAQFVDYYVNDWGAPQLAKTQAKIWYDSGVYTIFSAAGFSGSGTIAQAKEYRLQGKNVWAIGVDSDQYADGIYSGTKSAVLTSMVKRVEASTTDALKKKEAGNFKSGVTVLDMTSNGVDYATTNPDLSKDIVVKVDAVKKDIMSGKIKVYGTYKQALEAGVVPEGLSAKDN